MYSSCEARIYSTVIILMEGVYMYTVNICINVYVFNKFTQEVWNRLLGKDVQYIDHNSHTPSLGSTQAAAAAAAAAATACPAQEGFERTTKIKPNKTIPLFRIVIDDVAASAL